MPLQPKSRNIVWSHSLVSHEERRELLGHGAATLWFTGLSGSGKSTIATHVEQALVQRGACAYVLDGDNVRAGLSADLGFEPDDRSENIRRVGQVAKLFNDAGILVLTAFISPYRSDRQLVREIVGADAFLEIHVDCPLEVCEQRDVKGLYRKARAGEISEFTGVSAPYEPPQSPDLRLPSGEKDLEWCVASVVAHLEQCGVL